MADPATLLLDTKIATMLPSAADAAGRTSAYLNMANAGQFYLKVDINQGAANTVLISVLQAQDSSGTNSKVLANTVPVYANLATGTSDALVRQTDAVNFTTDAGIANKTIIFAIDPSQFDVNNGFGHIAVSTGASAAGNITHAEILAAGQRFGGKTLPSMAT